MSSNLLELTQTMETSEFLLLLKHLIARKGRPNKIYSDNAGTFAAVAAWLAKVQFDEQFQNHLANNRHRPVRDATFSARSRIQEVTEMKVNNKYNVDIN